MILNEDWFEPVEIAVPTVALEEPVTETEMEPSTPEPGEDTGIANIIHDLIIDENEAVQGYNNAIANMEKYPELVEIMKDIANEEQLHIGQLEQALTIVSPNAYNIMNGAVEAEGQLDPGSPVDESLKEDIKMEVKKNRPGTPEYEANEGRHKRIACYRKLANIDEEFVITEDNIDDWALARTCTMENCDEERLRAEILGNKWSEYEI